MLPCASIRRITKMDFHGNGPGGERTNPVATVCNRARHGSVGAERNAGPNNVTWSRIRREYWTERSGRALPADRWCWTPMRAVQQFCIPHVSEQTVHVRPIALEPRLRAILESGDAEPFTPGAWLCHCLRSNTRRLTQQGPPTDEIHPLLAQSTTSTPRRRWTRLFTP